MLKWIFRHPIKGLSPETLQSVRLSAGTTMPYDRVFAFAHARSEVDRQKPAWVARKNFAVVAHSPKLVLVSSEYDENQDVLHVVTEDGRTSHDMTDSAACQLLAKTLEAFAGPTQPAPFEIIRCRSGSMTDSPTATLSILNLASLRDLSRTVGEEIDIRRFRGNLWVDCEPAWCERNWVGHRLAIGEVVFEVTEPIERCAAINVDLASGEFSTNLPRKLQRNFGHRTFGCLAAVATSGIIHVGDSIEAP